MVKIRLTRFGTNKKPFYRIIAADSRSPRDGGFWKFWDFILPKVNLLSLILNQRELFHGLKRVHNRARRYFLC